MPSRWQASQFLIVKDRAQGFALIDLVGGYAGITVNDVTQPRRRA